MTDDIPAAAMVITTTPEFPGREIEKPLGIVTHASVAPAWSRDRSGGRFALSASEGDFSRRDPDYLVLARKWISV